ncbi:MAG TPA: signal recognition particle-docking protein FtsY, partial [Clostridia bacterium]|nr:signal recognition particle-docking protein FtsY [Clostridia bacterium]
MGEKKGLFSRLKESLAKTKKGFIEKVEILLKSSGKIDEDLFEELEEILIQGDVGVNTTLELIDNLREEAKRRKLTDSEQLLDLLKEKIKEMLGTESAGLNFSAQPPTVVLVVGVNGVGKTTSIAKLAYKYKNEGKKVLLAAGDTFRAAAIEQLTSWANKLDIPIIKTKQGHDSSAVAYDTICSAIARNIDNVII